MSLSDLNAANITSGQFGNARLSDMNAAKLTGTIASDRLNLQESDIPDLLTSKITGGTFDVARIPG